MNFLARLSRRHSRLMGLILMTASLPLSLRATEEVCAGSPIPKGWIRINDKWNPTSCGKPTSIIYNVWLIEKFSDKPVGATMEVCASAPTPTGWVEKGKRWNPTCCGHPTTITDNMKTIKRLE